MIVRKLYVYFFLVLFSFPSLLIGQCEVTFEGSYFNAYDFNIVVEGQKGVKKPVTEHGSFRANVIFWDSEKIGIGTGLQIHRYFIGLIDDDSSYRLNISHGEIPTIFLPLNVVYKKRLFKLFKRSFDLRAHIGLLAGWNINYDGKRSAGLQERLLVSNEDTTYYKYSIKQHFTQIIPALDIGIDFSYKVLKNFSIGIQFRHYQGLIKIGELEGEYTPERSSTRKALIKTNGTSSFIGVSGCFHIPLKKTSKVLTNEAFTN